MLTIVDYGVGNLFSLRHSLESLGVSAAVTGDPEAIARADKLILPGVGAFGDAAEKLSAAGLEQAVKEQAKKGTYILGICLGMQLLLDRSFEFGEHPGLGLIHGDVVDMTPILPPGYKVPHIGWNGLHLRQKDHPLFRYIQEGDWVYFVHSFYAANCDEAVLATAEYGPELTAAVGMDNVLGCQFHPEKSGPVGLRILRAFCEL